MKTSEIIKALRRMGVLTGGLMCVGCGHEHNCGIHGCAIIREAADTIDDLNNFTDSQCARLLEKLQKAETAIPRWISVEERLPGEKQRVIVRCKTVGTTVGWRLWGEWMTDLGDGGSEVTHWMPLPEPPEEETT